MASGLPEGVEKTALGIAAIRAMESARPDRLFDDPLAGAFLEAAPGAFDAERRAAEAGGDDIADWGRAFAVQAVIRTRFYDDVLLAAVGDGLRQVVLLAAGLDSRAFRLAWPDGIALYELDLPAVLAFKASVLEGQGARPRCARCALGADLCTDWSAPLVGAGFRPEQPTAWLGEGIMIYLSAEDAERLLLTVGALSAPGSRIAFEFEELGTDPMRARARDSSVMAPYARLWKGGLRDPPRWLAGHGWEPEVHERSAVAARYGRSLAPSAGGFVTATRR